MDAKKKTIRNWLAVIVTVVFFAFQMYLALVKQLNPMLQSPLHLILALTLVFLYNPADKAYRKKVTKAAEAEGKPVDEKKLNAHAWMNWFDILLFICLAYMLWYVVGQNARLLDFVSVQPVYGIDYIFMVMTIVLLLIAVYRTLGIVLTIFIAVFILYAFTSPYLPGILFTKGKTFAKFIKQFCVGMTMGESGVFGTPLYTSANTLFYFIVFGAFFSSMGGGQLLIDIGMKFSNKSSGGPAKAAVISSGLMGMISGSAVANVATTGVMTIPMMKKVGYEPEEAGAVEAVASTGGQIMPPIMGVGAFIMAEMLGVPYSRVAAAAILPAVAYYFAVFILVDRLAAKHQNAAQEQDAKIKVERTILPRLYLLLPAVILVVMIIRGASLMRAGMMGIVSCLICDVVSYFINEKKDFVDLKGIWNCCLDGAKQAAEIAIPTAACGIMIGIVVNSGVAVKIAKLIGTSGEGSLFIALLIAALGCLLLGMALPTVAAYLIAVTLFASAIQGLGISALVTNMFIFYFGVVAQITPPVCLASFTAAGIAGASAWKTGWKAFSFAITAFIVPFAFVYRPAILLEGTMVEIIIAYCIVIAATYLLACGIAGYLFRPLKMWERIACYVMAFIFILPSSMSDIIGIAGCVLIMAYCFMTGKKNANKAQPA